MRRRHLMPFGAEVTNEGVRFALWAPGAKSVILDLAKEKEESRIPMASAGQGWFKLTSDAAHPGGLYGFAIDQAEDIMPDPASRYQPRDESPHSQIADPGAYEWNDGSWRGRPWAEAVIVEVHTGTATPEGTFKALEQKLAHYRETGITAIELMPVAETPGQRSWGYDGVLPFAPNNAYGTPDDLKSLVDRAHRHGLMVMLDVVYNHFGPSGNFLPVFAPSFFTERHQTPWGAGLNFDGEDGSDVVREFFIQNALYWLDEFHFDGLRFDAVHSILDDSSPHFLDELAARIRETFPDRFVHLVLENENNEAHRLAREGDDVARFDAQWNDDIHHCWHRLLTEETESYYSDFGGDTVARLGRCLAEGFAYQDDYSENLKHRRGEATEGLPPQAFVAFLQNHDQIGNRAQGERLTSLASPEALRTARAVLLLTPQIPMMFMGEEWGATTPFQFFVDFASDPALQKAVREGRAKEFENFGSFSGAGSVPDPASAATFEASRLNWHEARAGRHKTILAETRDLLERRSRRIVPLLKSGFIESSYERHGVAGLMAEWRFHAGHIWLAANFGTPDLIITPPAGLEPLWQSRDFEPGAPLALAAWDAVIMTALLENDAS